MEVRSLIKEVRHKVGDIPKTKFTDDRILSLINEGLDDLARKVDINKGELNLPVVPYQRVLTIPDKDFIKLLRVRYNETALDIVTFDKMDEINNWESKVGSKLQAIVYNLSNPRHLTLYPLLDETLNGVHSKLNNADGTLVDIPGVTRVGIDGIITDVELDDFIDLGYVPQGLRPDGTTTSIEDGYHSLNIKYVKRLPRVTEATEEIDLDEMFKSTLAYYVAGMLLLDDMRGENIQKGLLFVDKYKTELLNVEALSKNGYQEVEDYSVNYRTGFGNEYTKY